MSGKVTLFNPITLNLKNAAMVREGEEIGLGLNPLEKGPTIVVAMSLPVVARLREVLDDIEDALKEE